MNVPCTIYFAVVKLHASPGSVGYLNVNEEVGMEMIKKKRWKYGYYAGEYIVGEVVRVDTSGYKVVVDGLERFSYYLVKVYAEDMNGNLCETKLGGNYETNFTFVDVFSVKINFKSINTVSSSFVLSLSSLLTSVSSIKSTRLEVNSTLFPELTLIDQWNASRANASNASLSGIEYEFLIFREEGPGEISSWRAVLNVRDNLKSLETGSFFEFFYYII